MKETSINRNVAIRRVRIAALALFAGIIANGACANDATRPELHGIRVTANLQDENLVPNADFSNPGGLEPIPVWEALDDPLPTEDCCYVFRNRLGLPPTYNQATVDLTSPGATPDPSQRHTLKVKYMVWGNYSTNTPQPTLLFYELLQNETTIASKTVFPNGDNWVIDSVGVSPSQITGYDNLRIRLSLQLKPISDGHDQIQGRVAWARLEIR